MAATVGNKRLVATREFVLEEIKLSALTAGQLETITTSGVSGVAPFKVSFVCTTVPTSHSPVLMSWEGSDTSSNTVTLRFDTETGGDLAGAAVTVFIEWLEHATGGIS